MKALGCIPIVNQSEYRESMRLIVAIRIPSFLAGLLLASLACAEVRAPQPAAPPAPVGSPSQPAAPLDVAAESAQLRAALREEAAHLTVDRPKGRQEWIARTRTAIAAGGLMIDRPQILVVVDRSPKVQQMRLILAQPQGEWDDLGGTKVSTGQPGRRDHFLTPTGVFRHTDAILDWRAEGTFNAHHIRGLGESGMRVWDFGWQRAVRGWKSATKVSKMRLLVHATDPATLERRLGRTASEGCIRLPEAMDFFLDRHGVLDADYEQAAGHNPRFLAVLRPDRTPTPLAGNALVVIDSARQQRPPPQLSQVSFPSSPRPVPR
jgi:lipoprotein-anchoring transpeptidase ErfK/SrfK